MNNFTEQEVKDDINILIKGKNVAKERAYISEANMQKAIINWCKGHIKRFPMLKWINCSLNGVNLSNATLASANALGRIRGVTDLQLLYNNGRYSGLHIELKAKNGVVSKEQIEYMDFINHEGGYAVVCRSIDEAKNVIINYLNSKPFWYNGVGEKISFKTYKEQNEKENNK